MPYYVLYFFIGDGRKSHVVCVPVERKEIELRGLIWFYNRNQVQTPNEVFKASMVKAWSYRMYHFHINGHHPGGAEYEDPLPFGEFSLDSLIPTEVRHSVRGPRMRGCSSSGKTVRI